MENVELAKIDRMKLWSHQEIRAVFNVILERFNAGGITEDDARVLLQHLLVRDMDGTTWTIGSETGKWYRLTDDKWVEGSPRGPLEIKPAGIPEAIRCPKCGTNVPIDSTSCILCGNEFVAAKKAAVPPAVTKCAKCGASLSPGKKFCTSCGAKFEPVTGVEAVKPAQPANAAPARETPSALCPKCNARIRPGMKFCTKCGGKL